MRAEVRLRSLAFNRLFSLRTRSWQRVLVAADSPFFGGIDFRKTHQPERLNLFPHLTPDEVDITKQRWKGLSTSSDSHVL